MDGQGQLDVGSEIVIIHARKARGKILDLASYLAVRSHSHCTSASNWELLVFCLYHACRLEMP